MSTSSWMQEAATSTRFFCVLVRIARRRRKRKENKEEEEEEGNTNEASFASKQKSVNWRYFASSENSF